MRFVTEFIIFVINMFTSAAKKHHRNFAFLTGILCEFWRDCKFTYEARKPAFPPSLMWSLTEFGVEISQNMERCVMWLGKEHSSYFSKAHSPNYLYDFRPADNIKNWLFRRIAAYTEFDRPTYIQDLIFIAILCSKLANSQLLLRLC